MFPGGVSRATLIEMAHEWARLVEEEDPAAVLMRRWQTWILTAALPERRGRPVSNFTDASGNLVAPSIDPFFFSYSILNPAAPPAVSANMVLRNSGNGQYQIYNLGNNSILASYWLTQVATD
jgi:hypothetical protein